MYTDSPLNCVILLIFIGLYWRFQHGINRVFTWALVGLWVAVSPRLPGIVAVFARLCALGLSRPVIGKSPWGVIVKRCPWVISITCLKDTVLQINILDYFMDKHLKTHHKYDVQQICLEM